MTLSTTDRKSNLRKEMRAQRKALSEAALVKASIEVADLALDYVPLLTAQKVASYRAFAGEICTDELELRLNAQIYLPKITDLSRGEMHFYAEQSEKQMSSANRLGILEPSGLGKIQPPHELDVVLMPLVAFQRDGFRIGMGAGFYDRAFEFRSARNSLKQPLLIGIAHSFQEVTELQSDPWDVPLDAIITDRELIIV